MGWFIVFRSIKVTRKRMANIQLPFHVQLCKFSQPPFLSRTFERNNFHNLVPEFRNQKWNHAQNIHGAGSWSPDECFLRSVISRTRLMYCVSVYIVWYWACVCIIMYYGIVCIVWCRVLLGNACVCVVWYCVNVCIVWDRVLLGNVRVCVCELCDTV